MQHEPVLISVVIPTFRRPVLVKRAVESVLRQTYHRLEVIVVNDGPDDGTRSILEALRDSRIRVIDSGRHVGPSMARNIGVQAARGGYIALLDDDDEWIEHKLECQMKIVERDRLHGTNFLISCRVIARDGERSHVWPSRLFEPSGDLSNYLIDRRSPFGRPGVVCSGTLLFPRSMGVRTPFLDDEDHEDWSWLLLCVAQEKATLTMCEEALFIYNLNPDVESRSKRANWRATLDWARRHRHLLSGRAFASLLATKAALKAKRQHQPGAFIEIARAMLFEGQPRALHWLMLAGIVCMPARFSGRVRRQSFARG